MSYHAVSPKTMYMYYPSGKDRANSQFAVNIANFSSYPRNLALFMPVTPIHAGAKV